LYNLDIFQQKLTQIQAIPKANNNLEKRLRHEAASKVFVVEARGGLGKNELTCKFSLLLRILRLSFCIREYRFSFFREKLLY